MSTDTLTLTSKKTYLDNSRLCKSYGCPIERLSTNRASKTFYIYVRKIGLFFEIFGLFNIFNDCVLSKHLTEIDKIMP